MTDGVKCRRAVLQRAEFCKRAAASEATLKGYGSRAHQIMNRFDYSRTRPSAWHMFDGSICEDMDKLIAEVREIHGPVAQFQILCRIAGVYSHAPLREGGPDQTSIDDLRTLVEEGLPSSVDLEDSNDPTEHTATGNIWGAPPFSSQGQTCCRGRWCFVDREMGAS